VRHFFGLLRGASRPIAALQLAGFSGDGHHVLPLRKAAAYAEHPLLRNSEEICLERGNNATTVSWWNQWTLVTTWVGRGEKTIVGALADELPSIVAGRMLHYFVADTLAVVGYDMSLRQPTSTVLDYLKRSGMQELVVIASNPALRMLAYALGLAVVKRTRVFETREQAIEHCAKPPGVV
jgi:hypothetical protein